ncbi:MAG: CRISPR-associated helicase Cas3' [Thiobacillaceae bacterium]
MNTTAAMPRTPWGKRTALGAEHPLADHCLDVAAVFRQLLELPNLARLGPLDAIAKDRLAVVAYLHDFGKCNVGFQAKADPNAKHTAGHILEALALLLELGDRWPRQWLALLEDIAQWFENDGQALQMLIASLSHHGRPVSINDYQNANIDRAKLAALWSSREGYDLLAALDALAAAVRAAFPGAFAGRTEPIDATPTLQQRFAGLLMLADWIGSDTQFFPFRRGPDEDRRALATQAAKQALRAIGLIPPAIRNPKPFVQAFGFAPTPLQKALAESIPLDEDARLLLIESDTGSGKTEAALAWFFRLYAQGQVDGLYFALPTRVAARELYARVLKATAAAFDEPARPAPVLLAVPGYVRLDGEDIQPALTAPEGKLWDDNTQDLRREKLWSAERPKRFLAAPMAVGTIDQALLSALQVKHSLLRSVCLDRHFLVVDEVHASDPYMREVLATLLEGHRARGGWAMLLSATLGEAAASRYFGRKVAPLEDAVRRPYSLVSTRTQVWPMSTARKREIQVEFSPTLTDAASGDEALVPGLIGALQAGARVLVVCNTVKRANALFRRVEATLQAEQPDLLPTLFALNGMRCPHHGRFAREDRERLDAEVTARLGKGSAAGPLLLIGTQTLEQSLDIDADWLITDLAPMDVLIQRFGRLHRHAHRSRPPRFDRPAALLPANPDITPPPHTRGSTCWCGKSPACASASPAHAGIDPSRLCQQACGQAPVPRPRGCAIVAARQALC